MKRRTIFSVLAIVAILSCVYVLAGTFNYRRTMPWEHRAYITPRDVELGKVTMESGYDDHAGTHDYGDIGDYKTWDVKMVFTATLTNPETLTATFNTYALNITLTGQGSQTVDLTTTSQHWHVDVGQDGDVLMDLAWDSKDVENGSDTGIIIWTTEPDVV